MKENIGKIPVLDIPLFDGSIEDFYNIFIDDIENGIKINRQVSFCDANVLVSTKKHEELKDILCNDTYLNMADGMPGVWMGRILGAKKIDRCYGPDVFEYLISGTKDQKIMHFFTGGREGVADCLRNVCLNDYGNENIVGVHCPPFRHLDEKEIMSIANEINASGADVVWVGISSPKQDIYAKRLSKYLNVHYVFTVGAAFDFFTGNVKQAPRQVQRSGFEWLFRLLMEPKRLWKRYLYVIPTFIKYCMVLEFKEILISCFLLRKRGIDKS